VHAPVAKLGLTGKRGTVELAHQKGVPGPSEYHKTKKYSKGQTDRELYDPHKSSWSKARRITFTE